MTFLLLEAHLAAWTSGEDFLLFTAVWKLQQNLQSKYLSCSLNGKAAEGGTGVALHAWASAWQAARCPPPILSHQIHLNSVRMHKEEANLNTSLMCQQDLLL